MSEAIIANGTSVLSVLLTSCQDDFIINEGKPLIRQRKGHMRNEKEDFPHYIIASAARVRTERLQKADGTGRAGGQRTGELHRAETRARP